MGGEMSEEKQAMCSEGFWVVKTHLSMTTVIAAPEQFHSPPPAL